MRQLPSYCVMAMLISLTYSEEAYAAPPLTEQEQISTLKSLEVIAQHVDDVPALLYLTPAQIDAITSESPQTVGSNNTLGKSSTAERGQLHELKLQQVTINQLKATIAQQNVAIRTLQNSTGSKIKHDKLVNNLQHAVDEGYDTVEQLKYKIVELNAAKQALLEESNNLQTALKISKNNNDALQAEVISLSSASGRKSKKINSEQSHDIILPDNDIAYRDYSIGVSFGTSIVSLLNEREKQGIKADKRMVIAGAEDAVQGKLKLPPNKVAEALHDTEVAILAHEEAAKSENKQSGMRYIEQFKGEAQVKQASQGFYYRIDSTGKGEIKATDTVTIAVKESLVNGLVIKDMDASGMAMSQRLNAYPPLFKAVLMQMQNHGSITVVVPPELAYGDKGLPPSIPPGSTMVYNIRVLNVLP
ncbi:TPA: FKBP-type peptidyl-prolyl cis-trans isomerase [Serratia fonticola]